MSKRGGVVMWTLAIVLVVVALVVGVVGRNWSSAASSDRAQVAELHRRDQQLERRQRASNAETDAMREATKQVNARFAILGTALDAAIDAQQHVVDVHNAGSDLFNAGQLAAAADKYRSEGSSAVADEEAKVAAAVRALADVQTAMRALEEAING